MTIPELGARYRARKRRKRLDLYSDEELGMLVLRAEPTYWDLIHPGARRLYELNARSTNPASLVDDLFPVWTARRRADIAESQAREAMHMNYAALCAVAASRGLDVQTMLELARPRANQYPDLQRQVAEWDAEIQMALKANAAKRLMEGDDARDRFHADAAGPRDLARPLAGGDEAEPEGRAGAAPGGARVEDGAPEPAGEDGGRGVRHAVGRGPKGPHRDNRRPRPGKKPAGRAADKGRGQERRVPDVPGPG